MTTKIPFYYIWTPKYKLFADVLKSGLSHYSNFLEDKELFMTQEDFEATLLKSSEEGHFMTGCFLKIDRILELLHSLPENSYFLFSDADVILFPNKELKKLLDVYISSNIDCVCMRESMSSTVSNFGFCLFKVCDANRDLFIRILAMTKENPTGHDQTMLNDALKAYIGTHHFFPPEFVSTTSTLIDIHKRKSNKSATKNAIMVHQVLIHGDIKGVNAIHAKTKEYREQFNISIEYI
jgi:hypothetical protein